VKAKDPFLPRIDQGRKRVCLRRNIANPFLQFGYLPGQSVYTNPQILQPRAASGVWEVACNPFLPFEIDLPRIAGTHCICAILHNDSEKQSSLKGFMCEKIHSSYPGIAALVMIEAELRCP
jgi:hypothetical protein